MARIRTKENLVDKIGQDHSWRLREISELKNLIGTPEISGLREQVLCRSGIALLYAHWEGFVKKSGSYFLMYVDEQRHSISELRTNFITLSCRDKFDRASSSNKYSAFEEVTKHLIENKSARACISPQNVVDTQSNLSAKVLKEIIWCLGLNYDLFETKGNLIDIKLLGRRNHVAHGEFIPVDANDFFEMVNEVLYLMKTFKNLLENSCSTESYRAT